MQRSVARLGLGSWSSRAPRPLASRERRASRGLVAAHVLLLAGCSAEVIEDPGLSVRREAIVYGEDDRRELYEAEQPFAELARTAAVALIAPSMLRQTEDGAYALEAPRYGGLQSLCPGERFADQPAAASCSGVLLSYNLLATAGHCLSVVADGGPDCSQNRYVLGFAVKGPRAPIVIAERDVFDCKRVLARMKSPPDSPCRFDLALLELDRVAPADAAPVLLRDREVQAGESVAVIGYTAGLPVKIDRGARVIDARAAQGDYFTLNSDTFAVSSGSGVFDVEGRLVGLFARGRRDYDLQGSCFRVHREPDDAAPGYEEATQIGAVAELWRVAASAQAAGAAGTEACAPADYVKVEQPAETGEPEATGAPEREAAACSAVTIGSETHRTLATALVAGALAIARRRRILGPSTA